MQVDSWEDGTECEHDGNYSIKSTSSTPSKKHTPFPLFSKTNRTEVVYHFRVNLDGNEKFVWLQAASELGRLCSETVKTSVSLDVKRWVMICYLYVCNSSFMSTISCIRVNRLS